MEFKLLSSVVLIFAALAIVGCGDDDPTCDLSTSYNVDAAQFELDTAAIETYLNDNGINAMVHESGIRYVIADAGQGETANLCNNVTVGYEGRLMTNDKVFDGNSSVSFPLSRLIRGWQIGIPLVKSGGSITLYIPSGLAYGSQGAGADIPGNANLIFDIDLIGVN